MSGHSTHGGGHEPDLDFKPVVFLIPLSMIFLAVYVTVCWFGATASLSREMARKQTIGAQAGSQALKAFRAEEDSAMHGYASKEGGTVSIPIDRAMEMMVKESGHTVDSTKHN